MGREMFNDIYRFRLIIDVIEKNKLSNVKLAEIMGYGRNTIDNYRQAITAPGSEFLSLLSDYFGVNATWVHYGDGGPYNDDEMGHGEPFDRKGEKLVVHPLPGDGKSALRWADAVADPSSPEGAYNPGMKFRLSSVLATTARILKSGGSDGKLLLHNIDNLYKALMHENKSIKVQYDLERLRDQAKSLMHEIGKLQDARRKSKAREKKGGFQKVRKAAKAEKPKARKRVKRAQTVVKPKGRKAKTVKKSKK